MGTRPKIIHSLLFEVQVKTIMSHAWGKATHDIVYKSNEFSWGKSRVAYQIKAILEQAEFAISQIGKTEDGYYPASDEFEQKNGIIEWLEAHWPQRLPADVKRLADMIFTMCAELNISVDNLKQYLETDTRDGKGSNLLNLSPFLAIQQTLFNHCPRQFQRLKKNSRISFVDVDSLDIPPEIGQILRDKELLRPIR